MEHKRENKLCDCYEMILNILPKIYEADLNKCSMQFLRLNRRVKVVSRVPTHSYSPHTVYYSLAIFCSCDCNLQMNRIRAAVDSLCIYCEYFEGQKQLGKNEPRKPQKPQRI